MGNNSGYYGFQTGAAFTTGMSQAYNQSLQMMANIKQYEGQVRRQDENQKYVRQQNSVNNALAGMNQIFGLDAKVADIERSIALIVPGADGADATIASLREQQRALQKQRDSISSFMESNPSSFAPTPGQAGSGIPAQAFATSAVPPPLSIGDPSASSPNSVTQRAGVMPFDPAVQRAVTGSPSYSSIGPSALTKGGDLPGEVPDSLVAAATSSSSKQRLDAVLGKDIAATLPEGQSVVEIDGQKVIYNAWNGAYYNIKADLTKGSQFKRKTAVTLLPPEYQDKVKASVKNTGHGLRRLAGQLDLGTLIESDFNAQVDRVINTMNAGLSDYYNAAGISGQLPVDLNRQNLEELHKIIPVGSIPQEIRAKLFEKVSSVMNPGDGDRTIGATRGGFDTGRVATAALAAYKPDKSFVSTVGVAMRKAAGIVPYLAKKVPGDWKWERQFTASWEEWSNPRISAAQRAAMTENVVASTLEQLDRSLDLQELIKEEGIKIRAEFDANPSLWQKYFATDGTPTVGEQIRYTNMLAEDRAKKKVRSEVLAIIQNKTRQRVSDIEKGIGYAAKAVSERAKPVLRGIGKAITSRESTPLDGKFDPAGFDENGDPNQPDPLGHLLMDMR